MNRGGDHVGLIKEMRIPQNIAATVYVATLLRSAAPTLLNGAFVSVWSPSIQSVDVIGTSVSCQDRQFDLPNAGCNLTETAQHGHLKHYSFETL